MSLAAAPTAQFAPTDPTPSTVRVSRLVEHRVGPPRIGPARADPANRPPTLPARPPDARELRRLLLTVLEVLDRRRPTSQLAALLSIEDSRTLLSHGAAHSPGPRRLRSMRATAPAPGVVELCATVDHAGRVRALAARLELVDQRWHCALLRLV